MASVGGYMHVSMINKLNKITYDIALQKQMRCLSRVQKKHFLSPLATNSKLNNVTIGGKLKSIWFLKNTHKDKKKA